MNAANPDRDHLLWLHQKLPITALDEERFFCATVRDQLGRGWCLLDARYYAYGKVLGYQSWARPRLHG